MRPRSRSYNRVSMSPSRQYEYRRRSRSPPPPPRRLRSPSRSVSRSRDRHVRRRREASPPGDDAHRRRIEAPPKTRCLGVFGLSGMTTEETLHHLFSRYGDIRRINIVYDTHTGRSRGFCFIYYDLLEDAVKAKEALSGVEIDSRRIRVDFSITQRPHTPTPGIYKGKQATNRERDVRDRERERDRERRERERSPRRRRTRTPSPHRHRRRHRSPTSRSP